MELTESRCCVAGRDISYCSMRLEMQVHAIRLPASVLGGRDRHTFEAVIMARVWIGLGGQWTGGCVTCRLTFGREILCCCGGIVGNVSRGASERLHSLEVAEIAGKCHSADGMRETRCLGAAVRWGQACWGELQRGGGGDHGQWGQLLGSMGVRRRKTTIWQQQMIVCRHENKGVGAVFPGAVHLGAGVGFGPIIT